MCVILSRMPSGTRPTEFAETREIAEEARGFSAEKSQLTVGNHFASYEETRGKCS
jgi:hypothetical protein